MKKVKTRGIIILLIASLLWGFAFCVQSMGGKEVGAYTFNSMRMLLGALIMIPFIIIFDKKGLSPNRPKNKDEWKRMWKYGIACGIFLAIATNLQQVALNLGAEAGRAGFLTTLYIIIVPVVGVFIGKKFGWNMWVSVVIAIAGMYFLCVQGSFAIAVPDLLLVLCAIAFAFHICTIDMVSDVEALRFSAIQFLVCGVISFVLTLIFEIIPAGGLIKWGAFFGSGNFWMMIIYMALFSGCIGYTLQILGQRDLTPPVASMMMSLESVFSVIFGFLVLNEKMTLMQLLGCGLIFVAIIFAQFNFTFKAPRTHH